MIYIGIWELVHSVKCYKIIGNQWLTTLSFHSGSYSSFCSTHVADEKNEVGV